MEEKIEGLLPELPGALGRIAKHKYGDLALLFGVLVFCLLLLIVASH